MTPKLTGSSLFKIDAFHTGPDCHFLNAANGDPREVTEKEIEFHELDECQHCTGEALSKRCEESTVGARNPPTGGDA